MGKDATQDPRKWVAQEVIRAEYVARYERKGWLERDFFIGGRRYLWRVNVRDEKTGNVARHGILADLLLPNLAPPSHAR